MSREIQELREVVTKLVPMLAGKGLRVTQRGSKAYVSYNVKTNQPELVNIPNIPDDAKPEFCRAIQGFVDHEVAHVLITDLTAHPMTPQMLRDPKVQRLHELHNIVEDTMIEREMVKIFPGSRKNIHDLRELFISDITTPAMAGAVDDQERFRYLIVPMMRALAGHVEFQEYMDANGYWSQPQVAFVVKNLKPETLKRLPTLTNTKQTLEVARELEAIIYPPAPPPPPMPAPPAEGDSDEETPPDESKGKSQDKPDKKAGEGDGDGERDHSESEPGEDGEGEGKGDASEDDESGATEGGEPGSGDDAEDQEPDAEDEEDGSSGDGSSGDEQSPDDGSEARDGRDEADDEDGASSGDGEPEGDQDKGEDGDVDADNVDDASSGSASEGADEADEEPDDSAGDGASGDGDDGDAGVSSSGDKDDGSDGDDTEEGDEADGDTAAGSAAGDGSDESSDEGKEGETPDGNGLEGGKPESTLEAGEGDKHEAAEDPTGVGSDLARSLFDYGDGDFKEVDLSAAVSALIEASAAELMGTSEYNVYSREWDRIEPLQVPPGALANDWVQKLDESVRFMTGRLQKDVERMMAAKNRVVRVSGHRTGRIHAPSLHRAVVGDDRLFYRKEEHTATDTAVCLLVDNSGSMSGAKCLTAMQASYALSMTLDRVKIAHEVIGFTTGDFRGINRTDVQKMNEEIYHGKIAYHRSVPLIMPIYKSFAERMGPDVKQRMAYMAYAQVGLNGNIDGECLEYAAQRLAKRPERRKVMIVFSDGRPAGWNAEPHLYKVVRDLETKKIETIGIGIMDTSVSRFYPKFTVLKDLQDFPGAVMRELKALLS